MIELTEISKERPYLIFEQFYELALKKSQKNIDAICISSFSKKLNEVSARFVNLKIIKDNEFIFFSNYNSPKANDFQGHNQITALIYWNEINIQIRLKAIIKKTNRDFNVSYFKKRDKYKNALAISSSQSEIISSYKEVSESYLKSLSSNDLYICPDFWGGYSFTPYYFEFWEGHESRLNKREVYKKNNNHWDHFILQP